MQSKEKLIELQTYFSRRHVALLIAMLLFISVNLIITNDADGLKYVPCIAISLALSVDVFFGYFTFFHKYKVLLISRIFEVTLIGLFISDIGDVGVGGISDIFSIIFYTMFVLEFSYIFDLSEKGVVFLSSLFIQTPYLLKIIFVVLSAGAATSTVANYLMICIISFMVFFAILNYIGSIQKYQEQCLFAKDRLIDRAKDNFDKIDESQKSLVAVNEQLGIKKFELEEAYQKINMVNSDITLQNEILKIVLSSLDLKTVLASTSNAFREKFQIYFSGLIFQNIRIRLKYDSGIGNILTDDDDLQMFYDFFLSDAFLHEHMGFGENFILNDISYDEFPFFEKAGIRSIIVKSANPQDDIYKCIYVIMSRRVNEFKNKETLFDNILSQIEVAGNNVYLYNKVEELSNRDALSSLYNRRYLNLYFSERFIEKKHDGIVAVAMIDIDFFKSINDTYGHLFGDQAIKTVSSVINDYTVANNGLAFRYGGEEFVVILENKTVEDANILMQQLRIAIKETAITHAGISINVNVSIGVTEYPDITKDISVLIDRADKAMYYSKQHGRDQVTIDNGQD